MIPEATMMTWRRLLHTGMAKPEPGGRHSPDEERKERMRMCRWRFRSQCMARNAKVMTSKSPNRTHLGILVFLHGDRIGGIEAIVREIAIVLVFVHLDATAQLSEPFSHGRKECGGGCRRRRFRLCGCFGRFVDRGRLWVPW